MNRDDIIRMAREAGIANWSVADRAWYVKPDIEKAFFAGAAAEREACAKVCDNSSHRPDDMGAILGRAIRARGTP